VTGELSCDYALARPAPHAVRAAGYTAVWRYLSGGNQKDLTASEATALHAAGLGIGLIWETTGQRALDGAAAGTADGHAATVQAHALGAAAGSPLLCNVGDFAATPDQISVIHAYYRAFRLAVGAFQPGGYATGYIIDQLVAAGAVGLWWQNAMNDAGELGSHVSPHADVYQRVTPTLHIADIAAGMWDEDAVVKSGSVHWWQSTAPPVPVPDLEGILVALPGGASRKVLSKDGGKSWT
jgi:hypothetical protein